MTERIRKQRNGRPTTNNFGEEMLIVQFMTADPASQAVDRISEQI